MQSLLCLHVRLFLSLPHAARSSFQKAIRSPVGAVLLRAEARAGTRYSEGVFESNEALSCSISHAGFGLCPECCCPNTGLGRTVQDRCHRLPGGSWPDQRISARLRRSAKEVRTQAGETQESE